MEALVTENAKDEDGDNQRIGSSTTQTIATHDVSGALHIDDGEGDDKNHGGVEHDINDCTHISTLGTKSLSHLQEVMYAEYAH